MPLTQTKQDVQFWQIVKNLRWRLDDGGSGPPVSGGGGSGGGGGGAWPRWATHLIAFLLGGVVWGTLLFAPPAFPPVVLAGLVCLIAVAIRRRWR
ncbi:MAG TPA: hypothetical protein VFA34_06555 [Actinomycetota bacterium]|nr:hypothetical protein [Actinomycetota bacterium]